MGTFARRLTFHRPGAEVEVAGITRALTDLARAQVGFGPDESVLVGPARAWASHRRGWGVLGHPDRGRGRRRRRRPGGRRDAFPGQTSTSCPPSATTRSTRPVTRSATRPRPLPPSASCSPSWSRPSSRRSLAGRAGASGTTAPSAGDRHHSAPRVGSRWSAAWRSASPPWWSPGPPRWPFTHGASGPRARRRDRRGRAPGWPRAAPGCTGAPRHGHARRHCPAAPWPRAATRQGARSTMELDASRRAPARAVGQRQPGAPSCVWSPSSRRARRSSGSPRLWSWPSSP